MEIVGLFTLMLMKNELTVLISIRLLIEVIAAGYFYINCTDSAGQPLPV
jgi:palmitoyltransferase